MILTTKLAQLASVHCASVLVPVCPITSACARLPAASVPLPHVSTVQQSIRFKSGVKLKPASSTHHTNKMDMKSVSSIAAKWAWNLRPTQQKNGPKSVSNRATKWVEIYVQHSNKTDWNLRPRQQQNWLEMNAQQQQKIPTQWPLEMILE